MLKVTPRGLIEQAWDRKENRISGNLSVVGLLSGERIKLPLDACRACGAIGTVGPLDECSIGVVRPVLPPRSGCCPGGTLTPSSNTGWS